jgi:oxygen-dependent protoporphyrinogen oxidase
MLFTTFPPPGVCHQGLAAAGLEGVLLGGNYVCGVALGKCVEHGYDFANRISSYVTSNAKVAA